MFLAVIGSRFSWAALRFEYFQDTHLLGEGIVWASERRAYDTQLQCWAVLACPVQGVSITSFVNDRENWKPPLCWAVLWAHRRTGGLPLGFAWRQGSSQSTHPVSMLRMQHTQRCSTALCLSAPLRSVGAAGEGWSAVLVVPALLQECWHKQKGDNLEILLLRWCYYCS